MDVNRGKETCLCGTSPQRGSSLLECAAMSRRAKDPQEAGDKRTEGSGVTSCPCVGETMPSVNKPKLAVMTEVR